MTGLLLFRKTTGFEEASCSLPAFNFVEVYWLELTFIFYASTFSALFIDGSNEGLGFGPIEDD